MRERWNGDPAELGEVRLDITTLTLEEASQAEAASGRSVTDLLRGAASRKLLALFVHGLRNYENAPRWSELSSLRLLDASPSHSQEDSGSPSQTSGS